MSKPVIQKYGGRALSTPDALRDAAAYACEGGSVVALTSAMGDSTTRFFELFHRGSARALRRYTGELYDPVIDGLPQQYKDGARGDLQERLEILPEFMRAGMEDAFVGSPEGHSA